MINLRHNKPQSFLFYLNTHGTVFHTLLIHVLNDPHLSLDAVKDYKYIYTITCDLPIHSIFSASVHSMACLIFPKSNLIVVCL